MIPLFVRRRKWWLDAWLSLRTWDGKAPAPRPIKQLIVKGYGRCYGIKTLVETGTYLGEMTAAVRSWFKEIHTIELDPTLANQARKRFRRHRGIEVYQADSAAVLPGILERLANDAVFWLDAHYSGGPTAKGETQTPIERELELVLGHPKAKVVLIDDARAFGSGDYPSLEVVSDLARASGYKYEVDMDIIRLTENR